MFSQLFPKTKKKQNLIVQFSLDEKDFKQRNKIKSTLFNGCLLWLECSCPRGVIMQFYSYLKSIQTQCEKAFEQVEGASSNKAVKNE